MSLFKDGRPPFPRCPHHPDLNGMFKTVSQSKMGLSIRGDRLLFPQNSEARF